MDEDLLDFNERTDGVQLPIYNRRQLITLILTPIICLTFEFAGFGIMSLFVMISTGVLTGYLMSRYLVRKPKGAIYVLSWMAALLASGLLLILRYDGDEFWETWAVWGAGVLAPLLYALFNKR
ncbi:MAG: hypothetical protein HWE14_02420 [Flavobacteriia bacterium]|nr:hypothetical protein [Flavobacteriia bacterium]